MDRIKLEQHSLGSAILGHTVQLIPGEWVVPAHKIIRRHIRAILKAGGPLDIVTLADSLAASGELAEAGGLSYLGAIVMEAPPEPSKLH